MMNYFEKCRHCVAPTRYPGCQDHCEHYKEARAKYDADKARANQSIALKYYINEKRIENQDGVVKYIKRRPKRYRHG